ncbi:hypothetical protein [Sphaerotilus montanus]|uniref:hypothetical protein n=1 Tax=Sphaerotilus montanus TaxID=522889 RepID=UPI003FA1E74D
MTQAGGPAAINGFLYQILNHLAWLKNVHIGEVIAENGKSEDAFMVLEPRNGGDARLENGMTYVVEQYKVRSNRTWAVKSIIEGVLPDLRKSIPNFTGAKCAYIFVTDGRQGDAVQYKKFREFLDYLQNCTLPSDIDHQPLVIFGNDFPKTRKELFDYIVAQTRTGSVTSQQESEDLKVLELLQNFQMKFEYSVEDRIQEVESFLRQFVPNLGDEVDIRYRLVGQLMEMLSNGEVRLDSLAVDAILREAGLNPDRIRRLVILNEVMVPLVNEEVERMKYIPAKDVRRSPIWPEDKSVLVISGDSGNGKTWQLIKTILGLREINKLSIIVRQAGTAEQTLFRASRLVWQAGLGETSEKSLESLALHYKDMRPGGFVDWLTIGIDDVRDAKTAEDYINQPWKRWGMRLVVTVPKSVVRSLKEEMPAHVHFHEASKFSVEEIDTFLKAYGKNWTDLPADLQKILRVPILAGIYADLEYGNFQSAPNTEYEIFERFWGRMQSKASSGDPGVLLALAGRVIDEQTYPLSRYQWNQVGLTDDVLARLDTVGWLQCHSDGDVYFSHDRLLNWAAAKKIGHLLKVHQWNWGHISKFLEQCALPRWGESKRLDYLPMDVVWLLLADDRNLIGLKSLLEFFERSQAFGSYAADLYKYLLPTLGYRVVPLLMIRLEKIVAQEQEEYLAKLISEAMSI